MTAPNFVQTVLVSGTTAHAADINAMTAGIATYLGNDVVTTDAINDSGGAAIMHTDGTDIYFNCPNVGGSHKIIFQVGGVTICHIDSSGNVVFKGTVTPSGSP